MAVSAVVSVVDGFFADVAAIAVPSFDYRNRFTQHWFGMPVPHMLLGVAAYAVVIGVGLARRPANWRTAPAEPRTDAAAKKAASLGDMWAKDKVRVAQIVYNSLQVRAVCEREHKTVSDFRRLSR